MKPGKNDLRSLPAVDTLLDDPHIVAHIRHYGRPLTVEAVRAALADARSAIQSGSMPPVEEKLLQAVNHKLNDWLTPTLIPVINATGVVLHTNLGRAPLSDPRASRSR